MGFSQRWVVVVAAGSGAGAAIVAAVDAAGALELRPPVPALLYGGIYGGTLGLAQWLVLRRRGVRAHRWLVASSVGAAVAVLLAAGAFGLLIPVSRTPLVWSLVTPTVPGLAAGAAVAWAQAPFVLGSARRRSWVRASAVGGALFGLVAWHAYAAGGLLATGFQGSAVVPQGAGVVGLAAAASALGGAAYAAATATALPHAPRATTDSAPLT